MVEISICDIASNESEARAARAVYQSKDFPFIKYIRRSPPQFPEKKENKKQTCVGLVNHPGYSFMR